MAAAVSASATSLDDLRVHTAVETIRALRAVGVEDPFAALRDRLTGRREDQRETEELLLLADALIALAAEAEVMAFVQEAAEEREVGAQAR